MNSARYSWRIVVFAAISLIGNFYLGYYLLFGLAPDGIDLADKAGHVVVTDVGDETPGARAGVQAGDQVVSVNGQRIGTAVDWLAQRMNFVADQPTAIRVHRGEKINDLALVIHGRIWDQYSKSLRASEIIFLMYKLITLAIGLFVVFSRPRDFVSRLGGWVLVAMATVFEAFQWGLASSIRALPVFLAVPVMLVYVSAAFRTPLLASFFSLYPKRLFHNRWLWMGFWVGPAVATVYALYLLSRTIYDPQHLSGLAPPWVLLAFGAQSMVYMLVALVVLPLSYWKLETLTDRRRFRVLVFGALIAMLFYLPRVIGTAFLNLSPRFYDIFDTPYANLVSSAGMLILPISFAYAILKHRLFDLRVIIRRGVQYALARRVLVAIPALALGFLLLDLLTHGTQPFFSLLKTHAPTYVSIAALTALVGTQRQKWLSLLDRRFFRDKYDAQQLFREILEEIRRADSIELVAPRVVTLVSEALHTSSCGLLVRKPSDNFYRIVAMAPPGSLTADLPVANKVIPLVRMLECSLPISQARTGWLGEQLPQVDKEFLRDARLELLVPVALTEGNTEALLVLGGKRSEEPYSKEDIALLENVAGALALLLARGNALQPGRAFEECLACGTCYDSGTLHCKKDKSTLTLVASPRVLAGRYRLDQRLGQGGMGNVYQAEDLSLNRVVAVKMIRDEFFANQKARDKFKQESQVTGSFAHPNVVRVYDFGLEKNQRAFLVMELLEGITLREELRTKRRLEAARTLALFEGICAGVEAAHSRGLVHRDLKPENIFLSRMDATEVVKITDFGIAKMMPEPTENRSDTMTATLVGTLRYMSPEQLRGRIVSPKWDLWAMAVIAYEALCGAAPFEAENMIMLESVIRGANFQPVTDPLPDAPSRWQTFFERAFAPVEDDRPESVKVFWNELQQCLQDAA